MSDEELDAAGALSVDEDQDELLEDLSLEERKERLKKARWNVFMYLGVAAILFGFALFPMPFSAEYDGFTQSAEKDVGFVWGVPVDGEDIFDVPVRLTVTATKPPSQSNVHIGVYMIEQEDCASNLGTYTTEAREGDSHSYQYKETQESVQVDGEYEFEFAIDPGHYCVIVEYMGADGEKIGQSSDGLSVRGKLYPNQFFGGILGIICLSLSAFAFVGAQKHGSVLRSILEGENETTESKVLSEVNKSRIASGPSGPPGSGPSGPPDSGPSGPPQEAGPEGPPETTPVASPDAVAEPVVAEAAYTFEPAENGYFYKKMADGSYDQTVFVQGEDGEYVPHQTE